MARHEGVTFTELLKISLQREIERRTREAREPFRVGEFVVDGQGVAPGVREGDWFDLIYPPGGPGR